MKKLFIIVIGGFLLLSVVEVQAQVRKRARKPQYMAETTPKFSIMPLLGVGFGLGRVRPVVENWGINGTDYEEDAQGETIKNKNMYYSAGAGIKLGLGVAYNLFEGIDVGADIGYSMGLTSEVDKSKELYWLDSTWATTTAKAKTSYIFFSPTLQIEKGMMGLTPFCGFGFIFALAPKSIVTSEYRATGYNGDMEAELTHNLGMGSCGVVGLKYALMGGLELIGELRVDQLSFKASHGELTKYTVDGKDWLDSLTTRDKEVEYREDDAEDDWENENKPDIDNTFITPANSVSIRVGVGYSF